MKNIKTLIFLTLLILSTSIYAQSKDSLLTKTNLFKSFNFDLKNNDYTINFKNIDFSKNNLLFSSYNESTKLNDIYLLNNDSYIYNKSSLIFENNFRGNKIDSFNLYGASNIGSALIFGLVGSILK
ncbi:hypothetical protein [Winogradskyella undariae]|uniref:hypothetical protein n=1 Tax=Winogradskyella undariae TaxID=1285465 RepID=UPI0015CBB66B|nr:hypothetical protein [Winogradskyella undariae]